MDFSEQELLDKREKEFQRVPSIVYGATGTEIFGGYLVDEFLGELRNTRERYDKYNQMRNNSGIIKMCIKAVSDQIRSAKWSVRPSLGNEEDPLAEKQMAFFNDAISQGHFQELVNDMTTSVIFGFYIGELYYLPYYFENKLKLRPFVKFMSQRTITRWFVSKDKGLRGIEQQVYGDTIYDIDKTEEKPQKDDFGNTIIRIPRDKLVHVAIDQEGDNYEGISLLRACYGSWVRKNNNYKKIAIGNHYLSIPFLKIYDDKNAGKLSADDEDYISTKLKERSNGDKTLSHIIFPHGWRAEEQTSNFDPDKLYSCNDKEDIEIVRSFCANFLLLTKGAGSHALSNDLSDFFLKGLEEIAKTIDISITRDVVKRTIEINFDEECLIECSHSEIGGKGGLKLSDAISRLIGAGAVTPDDVLERWVRDKFAFPKQDHLTSRKPTQPAIPEEDDNANKEEDKKKDTIKERGGALKDNEKQDDQNKEDEESKDEEENKDKQELSSIRLASPSKFKSQASASNKRIKKLQINLKEVLTDGLIEVCRKQSKKIGSFVKKNKGTQNVYKIKIEDFQVSTRALVTQATDAIGVAFDDETKSLSDTIKLGRGKLRSVLAAKMMLKNMASADISDAITKLNMAMVYEMLSIIDTIDDPIIIQSMLLNSTSRIIETKVANSKVTALPSIAVNTARKMVYESEYANIESYTFYNPSPVAEICVLLAGKTIDVNDPDFLTYQPPLHPNCATVILPNLKEFKNNPKTEHLTPNKKQMDSISLGVKGIS